MSHQHQCSAGVRVHLEEQLSDPGASRRIEIARRLVSKEYGWLRHERPRERDTLLLAPGELARVVARTLFETHLA